MDKNILVIGNGFDLYHGLKTGYYDFVKYAEKTEYNENLFIKYFVKVINENDGWIDCENEIEYLVNLFQTFLKSLVQNGDRSIDEEKISIYDIDILKSFDFINSKSGYNFVSKEITLKKGYIDKKSLLTK